MITGVCTDIDGTLLDHHRELSPRTIRAIASIRDVVPVILASSRMPAAMTHLQRELGISGHPLICYNGGYVLKPENDTFRVVDSVEIPLQVCSDVVDVASQYDVHVSLYHADDWYAVSEDKWTIKEETVTKVSPAFRDLELVINDWKNAAHGGHKIMCMGPEAEISDLLHALKEAVGSLIHIYESRPTYLELAPGNVSKGSALELVMQECYGLDLSGVMAFGDNYNDIAMLTAVGFGIAVANSNDSVKDIARELTGAGKDDGVASYIESHISEFPQKK